MLRSVLRAERRPKRPPTMSCTCTAPCEASCTATRGGAGNCLLPVLHSTGWSPNVMSSAQAGALFESQVER